MVDAVSGLLGGLMGGGTAVADIAQDKRRSDMKALRDKLMMEAEATIAERLQGKRFEHDEAMADKDISARKALQGERITADKDLQKSGALLNRENTEAEIKARKNEGLLNVGPFDKVTDSKGNEITRGTGMSAGSADGALRPQDEVKALAEINEIYKQIALPKEKGGISWKPGDEIPIMFLDQLNALRKFIGKPPLTKTEAKTRKWWGGTETKINYQQASSGQSLDNDPLGIR